MARPAKFDRDEALETAMHEIWRHGFEAASVKALSERLGITRSSFYNAFGSREALFFEVLARYAEGSPDRAIETLGREVRLKPYLTGLFRAACRLRADDPDKRGCLIVNSISELCPDHDDLGEPLIDLVARRVDRLEELIDWAVARGELPPETDSRATALALKTLFIGLNVLSKSVHDEASLWTSARTTLRGLNLLKEDAEGASQAG